MNNTHFMDENAEAQRRDMICPRSCVRELGYEFWKFDSRVQCSWLCSGCYSRSWEREGTSHQLEGVSGGSKKVTLSGSGALGGFSRAGGGGKGGWGCQVEGTAEANVRWWESRGSHRRNACVTGKGQDLAGRAGGATPWE